MRIIFIQIKGESRWEIMKILVGSIPLVVQSIIMTKLGYDFKSWQWWAIIILTILYHLLSLED